ncbi:MAG: pilus assembly protein [Candidatus Solibacter sp.]|nr:pilus assembly protein [Candidatus Solibacter sp.]
MVEVCLILTPLLLLTFAILNVSMAIFLRSTFQQAVREGARYAITGQVTAAGACHDTSIKTVVARSALGFLSAGPAAATMHVRFRDPATGAVASNSAGNIVEVSVENYQYGPLAPFRFFSTRLGIWAQAADVMGGLPSPPSICLAE